jgi:integrase
LKCSKTDQEGKGRTVGIVKGADPLTCPIAAVKAWLRAANIEDAGNSAVFYPVNRWGSVELNRLSDKSVDDIVKGACRAAGLKDKGYSAHSLRAGHVTEALAGGADRSAVKRQTGHASDAMLDRYAREADLFKNNSSGNLGL